MRALRIALFRLITPGVFLFTLPLIVNATQPIDSVLKLPDGQRVTLYAVWIDKASVKPSYIVVREHWAADLRIVVLLNSPPSLQKWQIVDVDGVLTSLRNGYRAIIATDMAAYSDAFGRYTTIPIPPKTHDGPTGPWPWRSDMKIDVSTMGTSIAPQASVMDAMDPPNPDPEPPNPPSSPVPAAGTIPWAKFQDDGTPDVTLSGKIVSRAFPTENLYYIQEPDRASGIKALDGDNPAVTAGTLVSVTGTMRTDAVGERYVEADGSLNWSYALPSESGWNDKTGVSSLAIGLIDAEARAYVGSDNGHVYSLSATYNPAQRVIWDYADEDGLGLGCIESSPTVYAGYVYVGTSWYQGRALIALDAATGGYIWHREPEEETRGACAEADEHIDVGVDTGYQFFRLHSATGDQDPSLSSTNPFGAMANCPSYPEPVGLVRRRR